MQGHGRERHFRLVPKILRAKGSDSLFLCWEHSTVTGVHSSQTQQAESLLQRHIRSPGLAGRWGNSLVQNGLCGLALAVNATRQLQFLLLCNEEERSVVPASCLKQHVLDYLVPGTPGYQPSFPSQSRRAWEAIQMFRAIFLQEYELQKKI